MSTAAVDVKEPIHSEATMAEEAAAGQSSEPQPGSKTSKNQLKKQRKQELRQMAKQLKKAESKKRKAGDIVEPTEVTVAPLPKRPQYIINDKTQNDRKLREAEEHQRKCASNFSIIIDCGWEDKHTESTLKSLTQQIMFCYGANRRHNHPASMYLTGVGPRVTTNLMKSNFKNWLGVTISEDDYIKHPHFSIDPPGPADSEQISGSEAGSTILRKKQLVYLTSDAEETLDTLDPDCAYIIGGIVDRNMHKFATFRKATAQGVRTAKLPIKENFALAATHVLTVNHVYEILLNYGKYKDWVRAIKEVLPQRKGPVEKGEAGDTADGGEGDGSCSLGKNTESVTASETEGFVADND